MNNQIGFEGQDMELFKQFVDFCDKQPKGNLIDHSTWDTCAYGDFLRDCEVDYWVCDVLGYPSGDCHNPMRKAIGNGNCPATYGPFTEFLKQYLPEGSYWNSSEPS